MRLTEYDEHGNAHVKDFDGTFCAAIDRLAAYEDMEEQGRLVVLPCKDDVSLLYKGTFYKADHWNPPLLTAFADDPTTKSGQRVHLFSPEEAERAMEVSGDA